MSGKSADESLAGVPLTNLDQPLFDGAGATKRDLVDYLDAVHDAIIPALQDRPLSVIRVHRGQEAFMQKNVPKYTPPFVRTVDLWAEASHRSVSYALCNDLPTLIWFANQRAIEYHPSLARIEHPDRMTHLVLDLDPPEGDAFASVVRVARLVREALGSVGLEGAIKTSGAKGLHIFVPIEGASMNDAGAATRAIAARAEKLDPEIATTAFMKEDRDGKVFVDATRASAARRSSPRTARGCGRAFPSRSRWVGTTSTASCPPTSPFTTRPRSSAATIRGPSRCPIRKRSRPCSWKRVMRSRSRAVQAMHEGKRRARARRTT